MTPREARRMQSMKFRALSRVDRLSILQRRNFYCLLGNLACVVVLLAILLLHAFAGLSREVLTPVFLCTAVASWIILLVSRRNGRIADEMTEEVLEDRRRLDAIWDRQEKERES